jgi:serine protease Do
MKDNARLLAVGLLSAVLSVGGYRYFENTSGQVALDLGGNVRFTNFTDALLSGRNQQFSGAAPTNFTAAAESSTPSVVNIKAMLEKDNGFFGGGTVQGSSGSGVILSPDGYIVTNHHVVEKAKDIKVTLNDHREFRAKLIGSDPSTDIAVLKIEQNKLPFMLFGNSDSVRVGEWVLAVGNPFNLESTVTAGIISAKGRNINILTGTTSIESFLQTDAAVNPGNSGGALVNTAGELIGINTAIITETGNYEGYSFAVPSNLAQKVVRDLKEFGFVQRAFLGVGIQDVNNEIARDLNMPNAEGVYLNSVNRGGAGNEAGLETGDVILAIDGVQTRSSAEMQEIIGRKRPGEQISIEYWRDDRKKTTRITLKNQNNAAELVSVKGDELDEELGLQVRDLGKDERKRLKLQGAMVTSLARGSIVWKTNMEPGYVISSVNGRRVATASEAIDAIKNARGFVSLDGYYEGYKELYSYEFKKK